MSVAFVRPSGETFATKAARGAEHTAYSAITMAKSKTKTKKPAAAKKPAAKKRGRAAAAKTTQKSSKEPASVTRCPYARAEFYIEGGGGDSGWNGEEMYSGGHPATSTPACGELLQFKVPRKWLDIDAKNFEYYTFCFVLHLKKKNKNKSGADDRVGTRTEVINGDDRELVDSVREHFQAKLRKETTAEYAEGTWVGRGDASTVRIAMRRKPRQNWKYQINLPGVAAARDGRHGARVELRRTGRAGRRRTRMAGPCPWVFLLGWAMMSNTHKSYYAGRLPCGT